MHAYVSCMYADDPSLLNPLPPLHPHLGHHRALSWAPVLSGRFPVSLFFKRVVWRPFRGISLDQEEMEKEQQKEIPFWTSKSKTHVLSPVSLTYLNNSESQCGWSWVSEVTVESDGEMEEFGQKQVTGCNCGSRIKGEWQSNGRKGFSILSFQESSLVSQH